jgi:CRISPR-associated protein Csm5
MKGQTHSERCTLEVLTPLHVGSGELLYLGMDYVEKDGKPFVVDQIRTFEAVADGDAPLEEMIRKTPPLEDLVTMAGNYYGYSLSRFYKSAVHPQNIRECVKDAFCRPYVPGSSLKGAIRTALLAEFLRKTNSEVYKHYIPNWKRDPKNPKKKLPSEKRPAFAAQKLMHRIIGKDPKHDVMRALHVADAMFNAADIRLTDVQWLNIIWNKAAQKEQLAWRDMASRNSISDWRKAGGQAVEALAPQSLGSVSLQWEGFLLSEPEQWLEPGQQDLLPPTFDLLRDRLNSHAHHRLDSEIAFHKKCGYRPAEEQCILLKNRIDKDPEGAFLQLAWGSGWRGMTGDWLSNEDLENMRKMYKLGKGFYDKETEEWRPVWPFPKTRRLAVDDQPRWPLGWVCLWQESIADLRFSGPNKIGSVRHPWLEETLLRIAEQTHCSDEEALRGKLLAEYWQALEDADVKQAVIEDIRSCWRERGWWNNPTGRAIKKAKTIYESKRS